MQDLTAQVQSGLLRFPETTLQALGEDEIALDSVLCGKFYRGEHFPLNMVFIPSYSCLEVT